MILDPPLKQYKTLGIAGLSFTSIALITPAFANGFTYQADPAVFNQPSIHSPDSPAHTNQNLGYHEIVPSSGLNKQFSGTPVSMDFQDVEVRSILHLLSQVAKTNIVASDDVSGRITLNLINVPWDQALDIILQSKNLGMRYDNGVIWVTSKTKLAEQKAAVLISQQTARDALPLSTEYIRLKYAKADAMMTLISQNQSLSTSAKADNKTVSASLLSHRGLVAMDARTNTLIIKDTPTSIENIRRLIEQIDIPVRQVMIEARIVSASDSFSKEIGVKWGMRTRGAATNQDLLIGGSEQTIHDLKSYTLQNTTVNGQSVTTPKYNITRPDNLNVDLGVNNAAGRIAFGLLSMSDLMIDLELSAMQADGRGEVISTPKILTMDNQTAKVSSGTKIPYQSQTENGGTSTEFEVAELSLEVTPNITPDGRIAMALYIENGRPNRIGDTLVIDNDTLSTNVLIEDGQTIVLGGIFRNQRFNNVEKVPYFGELPYVGRLFRKDFANDDKQELMIFLTPKLLVD